MTTLKNALLSLVAVAAFATPVLADDVTVTGADATVEIGDPAQAEAASSDTPCDKK